MSAFPRNYTASGIAVVFDPEHGPDLYIQRDGKDEQRINVSPALLNGLLRELLRIATVEIKVPS